MKFLLSSLLLALSTQASTAPSSQKSPKKIVDAAAPKLSIKGFASMVGGVVKQKQKAQGAGGHTGHLGVGDAGLYFRLDGGNKEKLAYAFVADLDILTTDFGVNKVFIELSGLWGTLQVGNRKGPTDTMFEDGIYVLGVGHGVDGGMWGLFKDAAGVIGYRLVGSYKTATKVIYYTPIVEGFQVAIAYTPNTSHSGDEARQNRLPVKGGQYEKGNDGGIYPDFKTKATPYGLGNIAGVIKYKQNFGDWMFGTSLGGLVERTILINPFTNERIPVHNAKSYGVSLTAGYKKIVAGLGYGNNGKSRLPRNDALAFQTVNAQQTTYLGDIHQGNSGQFWNAALAYDPGKYKIAVGYANTTRRNNTKQRVGDDAYVTYLAYRPLKGLEFFVEGAVVRARTNAAAMAVSQAALDSKGNGDIAVGNNVGYVTMVGTSVAF